MPVANYMTTPQVKQPQQQRQPRQAQQPQVPVNNFRAPQPQQTPVNSLRQAQQQQGPNSPYSNSAMAMAGTDRARQWQVNNVGGAQPRPDLSRMMQSGGAGGMVRAAGQQSPYPVNSFGGDRTNPPPPTGGGSRTPSSGGGWNLPTWNPGPNVPPTTRMGQQVTPMGGMDRFFGGDTTGGMWNPEQFKTHDSMIPNYVERMLPVAQMQQNAYQYAQDYNEAQRRWDQEFIASQGQNQFQQGLSTRQQQAAEEQARLAAQQWGQQFGWTQQTDTWNRDLSQQQISNQYRMGMDQNQATRDVAGTYADANRYEADRALQGQRYGAELGLQGQLGSAGLYSDAQRYGADRQVEGAYAYADAQKHAANMGVNEAHIGAAANRYGAELGMQGQLGSAEMYSGAQRYGSDQERAAAEYAARMGLQGQLGSAQMYSGAQRYGSDQERIAAMYGADAGVRQAGMYSGAQRYGAELGLQGQRYEADRGLDVAGVYGGAQRYGADIGFQGQRYTTDAQERMNQLQMQNNLAVAQMQAYGRSAAPNVNWARSWA